MKARRILWIYCVFACLALVIGLAVVVATSGYLRSDSAAASKSLKSAADAADAQEDKVSQMEEEQRAHRADLSAEDAIRYSAEVQMEQAKLDDLNTQRDAAQERFDGVLHGYQRHMARLIPIIALLILHIVGMMLFWPRKA